MSWIQLLAYTIVGMWLAWLVLHHDFGPEPSTVPSWRSYLSVFSVSRDAFVIAVTTFFVLFLMGVLFYLLLQIAKLSSELLQLSGSLLLGAATGPVLHLMRDRVPKSYRLDQNGTSRTSRFRTLPYGIFEPPMPGWSPLSSSLRGETAASATSMAVFTAPCSGTTTCTAGGVG